MKKYNTKIREGIKLHKIQSKWNEVKIDAGKIGINDGIVQRINSLDETISSIMRSSERKSTNVTKDILDPWSIKLHEAIQKICNCAYEKRQASKCLDNGTFDLNRIKRSLEQCETAREQYRTI